MSVDFSEYLGERVIYHDPDGSKNDALHKLFKHEWDIIAFRDYTIVYKNKDIKITSRDIVTNIKCNNASLFYVLDGNEYPIRDDTRFIVSLSPFRPIYIRIKNNTSYAKITYTILMMQDYMINDLRSLIVNDGDNLYCGGYIIK